MFRFHIKNLFLTNEHILYDIRNIISCTEWKSIDFPLRGTNSILMSLSNRYYSDYKIMTKFVFHFSIFLKLNNSFRILFEEYHCHNFYLLPMFYHLSFNYAFHFITQKIPLAKSPTGFDESIFSIHMVLPRLFFLFFLTWNHES